MARKFKKIELKYDESSRLEFLNLLNKKKSKIKNKSKKNNSDKRKRRKDRDKKFLENIETFK